MNPEEIDFILDLKKKIDAHCAGKDADDETCKLLYEKFYKIANSTLKTTNASNEIKREATPPIINDIKKDTNQIREHLAIRANESVNYDFIPDKYSRVKNELRRDNLRMENARIDLTEKDELIRFYNFCINAFYQIEQLMNYFFAEKFRIGDQIDMEKLYDFLIENNSFNFKILELDTEEKIKQKQSNVSYLRKKKFKEIEISNKITAFSNLYFSVDKKEYTGITLSTLRKVRNTDSHRCSVIINDDAPQDPGLQKFLKIKNYDMVRDSLIVLSNIIKAEL